MFSKLPGSLVWCLILIWGNFSVSVSSNSFFSSSFSPPPGISVPSICTFCGCPAVLGYSEFFLSLFSPLRSFGSSRCYVLRLRDSSLSRAQSSSPSKACLISGVHLQRFFLDSFLKPPSLHAHYLSVPACY